MSEPERSPLDGFWQLRGTLGWAGVDRLERTELWWFGEGRHGRASSPQRPRRTEPFVVEQRGALRLTIGSDRRRSCYLVRLEGDNLHLFGGEKAFPSGIGPSDSPAVLLERVAEEPVAAPERPPRIVDAVLGVLRQIPSLPGCYSGTLRLGRRKVSLDFLPNDTPNDQLVKRARAIASKLELLAARAARYAGRTLVDLKNEAWLEEGQRPVRASGLTAALRLVAVCVHDAKVTFEFDDGGMFWGHRIKVRADARGRFVAADL